MEIKRACLVLADISGYTRFMKMHTSSLLHAEMIITELLEAVIDHAEYPLTLSKLEGDAAFLYALLGENEQAAAQDVVRQVTAFFEAFRARERALIGCNKCLCDACLNIEQLKLKAIAHCGEVVVKTVRQFEELAGEDVILAHRLLKNSIPAKEYILLTDAFYQLSGGLAGETPEARTEEAEGIGPVRVHVYYPPEETTFPTRPEPGMPEPGTEYEAMYNRWKEYAMQRLQGREQRRVFSHLPDEKLTLLSWLNYSVFDVGHAILLLIRHRLAKKG